MSGCYCTGACKNGGKCPVLDNFIPFNPPRFNYFEAKIKSSEERALDDVSVYIKTLEDKIKKALVALDQGMPAHEVVRILQG